MKKSVVHDINRHQANAAGRNLVFDLQCGMFNKYAVC